MNDRKHAFQVTVEELNYLNQLASRDESIAELLSSPKMSHHHEVTMLLTRAEIEQLRDFLTTQLATIGFDESYSPNEQGNILENLLDRFCIR